MRGLLILTIILTSSAVSAQKKLGPIPLLERCYRHITGQRLPLASNMRKQVSEGADPIDTCLTLLNDVKLKSDGALTQSNNRLHRRILRQFADLHHSWFGTRTITSAELNDQNFMQMDLYDGSEASLHYTRSLFSDNIAVSSVLRGNSEVIALRDSSKIADPNNAGRFPRPSRAVYNNNPGSPESGPIDAALFTYQDPALNPAEVELATPLIQVGELYGVTTRKLSVTSPVILADAYTNTQRTIKAGNSEGWVVPHNLFRHYGGGAIGSQSYLMMNFGHGYLYVANGTTKLPRKWMNSVLEDFLCLKAPVLRESDVSKFARTGSGIPDFRKQNSCLRCHATLDQGALTTRNIRPTTTSSFTATVRRTPLTMGEHQANQGGGSGQEFWPAYAVGNFHRQAPEGQLLFRSSKGDLIDQRVSNIEALGTALSQSDDFYNCAAKRYVKYFTGINVELFDEQDPANAGLKEGLNDHDREFRKFVTTQGANLKSHQSLRSLIKSIMTSSYYQQSDYGRNTGVRGAGK